VIGTLRINIKDADDQNKITIIDFELNNFVVSVEGNWLNGKRDKLFSKQNVMLKKLARY
jgi:hypothetical protein